MAFPTVVFASGGSDTAASGAGPATAVTGTAAAHTNGAASTTITLTNTPDLSGVPTDGSAIIKLFTGSGRRFSRITAVDDGLDTVTVEDSFNIAAGSPVDYAIGGDLQTIDDANNRTLFGTTGAKGGWSIHVETDQTLTSALSCAANIATVGAIRFKGVPASGEFVKITQTANDECVTVSGSGWWIEGFNFVNTNGTKSSAIGLNMAGTVPVLIAYRCKFGDATDQLLDGVETAGSTTNKMICIDCEMAHCTSDGAAFGVDTGELIDCYIHDNANNGVATTVTVNNLIVIGCVIEGNVAGSGILVAGELVATIKNNTCHGNGRSGIEFNGADVSRAFVTGNNLTGNTRYGLEVSGGTPAEELGIFADWNNFGAGSTANSLGARLNINAGPNDTAVDPAYVDAANGNFEVGQTVRGAAFPDSARTIGANQSNTNSFVDIGAAQRDENLGGVILGARRRVR